jgi:hypothetical protein
MAVFEGVSDFFSSLVSFFSGVGDSIRFWWWVMIFVILVLIWFIYIIGLFYSIAKIIQYGVIIWDHMKKAIRKFEDYMLSDRLMF